MKIGHLDSTPAAAPAAGERGTSAKKTGGDASEASAQVELSDTASLLSTPEFDSDKVSRIAQAIRDGKFQVNAEVIADKLIANAQELLGKVSH